MYWHGDRVLLNLNDFLFMAFCPLNQRYMSYDGVFYFILDVNLAVVTLSTGVLSPNDLKSDLFGPHFLKSENGKYEFL